MAMINTNKENFAKLKRIFSESHIEESCEDIRSSFSHKGEPFSIFTMLSSLDTMVILFDDKINGSTRYISFSGDESKNYLVLSADRTVEEMRFDAACMLAKIIKKFSKERSTFCPNYTNISKSFSREEKHFACALLMPQKELIKFICQKDSNGNYLYLDENKEISFRNIDCQGLQAVFLFK